MTPIPYCGLPPLPSELPGAWKLDPIAFGVFIAILISYMLGVQRDRSADAFRARFFFAGWIVAVLAFLSPLCALSISLFSARIGQHMILILAAAPLLALGRPGRAATALLGGKNRSDRARPIAAAAAFALILWFWHAPAPYAWTFRNDVAYWLMHASLLLSACWLWRELFHRAPDLTHAATAAATMIQMSLLGALLALSPSPLFAPHIATTIPWGLTPLEDQQLGGTLMWVVGGLVFFALSLFGLWRVVEPERT